MASCSAGTQELITEDDLSMQLREQGLADFTKVKEAHIESDGRISVIENKPNRYQKAKRKGK